MNRIAVVGGDTRVRHLAWPEGYDLRFVEMGAGAGSKITKMCAAGHIGLVVFLAKWNSHTTQARVRRTGVPLVIWGKGLGELVKGIPELATRHGILPAQARPPEKEEVFKMNEEQLTPPPTPAPSSPFDLFGNAWTEEELAAITLAAEKPHRADKIRAFRDLVPKSTRTDRAITTKCARLHPSTRPHKRPPLTRTNVLEIIVQAGQKGARATDIAQKIGCEPKNVRDHIRSILQRKEVKIVGGDGRRSTPYVYVANANPSDHPNTTVSGVGESAVLEIIRNAGTKGTTVGEIRASAKNAVRIADYIHRLLSRGAIRVVGGRKYSHTNPSRYAAAVAAAPERSISGDFLVTRSNGTPVLVQTLAQALDILNASGDGARLWRAVAVKKVVTYAIDDDLHPLANGQKIAP